MQNTKRLSDLGTQEEIMRYQRILENSKQIQDTYDKMKTIVL